MRCASPYVRVSIVLLLLVATITPARAARAGEPRFADQHGPAVSGSIAVAVRPDGSRLHFWLGAGLRLPAPRFRAVLVGVELEMPLSEEETGPVDSHATMMASSLDTEMWLVSRLVSGKYAAVGWAPLHSVHAFAGVPMRFGEGDARVRFGVGASALELLPLAEIGIPNMIELGMDVSSQTIDGFLRLGWHF